MSSTPKPRDGDGSIAGSGAPSPLEQTVMGVAPPGSGGAPLPAMLAAPAPPAIAPSSLLLPSSTVVAASSQPQSLAPESFVLPSSTIVAAPSSPAGAPPNAPAPSSIAVTPMIAVSTTQPIHAPRPVGEAPLADAQEGAPSRPSNPIGETLRIEPRAPAPMPPPSADPVAPAPAEGTVLTDDYLRVAREAALQQVAQRAPSPPPLALASTERAPLSAIADALAGVGDTHRSIAPEFGPETPPSRASSVGTTHGSPANGGTGARGFEPVPVLRAPLAESLSNVLGPMAELGGTRNLLPPSSRPKPAPLPRAHEGISRWLLLAAVALVTVGVVSVGGRLWHRYRASVARERALTSTEAGATIPAPSDGLVTTAASRAMLANRPAVDTEDDGRVRVVSATPASPAPDSASAGGATQESQLAATAGRHVLSGNYAEALPIYRQLERGWPENTSYAAMARLLEKKVGSRNDTRTITPAASAKP